MLVAKDLAAVFWDIENFYRGRLRLRKKDLWKIEAVKKTARKVDAELLELGIVAHSDYRFAFAAEDKLNPFSEIHTALKEVDYKFITTNRRGRNAADRLLKRQGGLLLSEASRSDSLDCVVLMSSDTDFRHFLSSMKRLYGYRLVVIQRRRKQGTNIYGNIAENVFL